MLLNMRFSEFQVGHPLVQLLGGFKREIKLTILLHQMASLNPGGRWHDQRLVAVLLRKRSGVIYAEDLLQIPQRQNDQLGRNYSLVFIQLEHSRLIKNQNQGYLKFSLSMMQYLRLQNTPFSDLFSRMPLFRWISREWGLRSNACLTFFITIDFRSWRERVCLVSHSYSDSIVCLA